MNFYKKYFDTALWLTGQYRGDVPLTVYVKRYFSLHKKHGAKDRKQITHLCYSYYRLGHALKKTAPAERLMAALFLCTPTRGDWLTLYDNEWQAAYDEDINQRIRFIQTIFPLQLDEIFFGLVRVSDDIDKQAFAKAHLIQPNLFIRIRPGNHKIVTDKLQANSINYNAVSDNCIALQNATKIDAILQLNREIVVQDYSSQRIAEFLKIAAARHQVSTVWDCCAASGGKSILAIDTLPDIRLTSSDVRASILHNLRQRFKEAGIVNYQSTVADVTRYQSPVAGYDLVICDAPCSGSGTWARTPEQLFFFTKEKIQHYTGLQQKIVTHALKAVKKEGFFLYITCSVYKAENEEIIQFIEQTSSMKLIKAELLKGYEMKADSMFAALFLNG